jgi:hypothetical protein
MKFFTLTVTAILLSFSLLAQSDKDLPAFGKADKADLEMKECDFDKNAEAMVLFDVEESYCNISFQLIMKTERRVRIKILNDKGLENANIHIRYSHDNNMKPIGGLVAQTYNLDASGNVVTTKVEKSQIFDKPVNKRYSEIVFTFPQVKAGSIIEYKYNDESISLNNWYFQRSIPVKLSRFTLDFPNELEVTAIPYCVLPLEHKKDEKGNRDLQTYTMRNVPALPNEPYMSSDDDYLQRLETKLVAIDMAGSPRRSLVHSWPWVIKALMEDEDFGMQLKKNIPRTQDLEDMLAKITSPFDKMVTIHNYVRKNMQWNGYDNIWALDGVKSAWKDKKGTSGEINLILVNLLKDAGLNAHPVLVSTRSNGRVNTAYADYHQFDKVMAYVKIDDKTYTLDATEKYTPSKLIPLDVSVSEGLVIEKIDTYEWGWQVLWNQKQEFKTTVIINSEIDKDGLITGEASVISDEYARINRMAKLKEGKDKFIEAYFTSKNTGVKVDSFSVENEEKDSLPLIQKFQFTQPTSSSGDYKYFSANLFSGLEKKPFIADNRFSDIFFGANQHYMILGNFAIPDGYQFDELPKNTRMIMPDTSISFTRMQQVNDNRLSVRYILEFKKPFYSIEEYPLFKEFYKKLYGMLNEQFVIKKIAK